MDPGGFGVVTIIKSITIDCHEVFASILHSGTNGLVIRFDVFAATDTRKTVRLRNLSADRQPQPTAAGSAGFIHLVEALEDAGQVLRWNGGARVVNGDQDGVWRVGRPTLNVGPGFRSSARPPTFVVHRQAQTYLTASRGVPQRILE